MFLMGGALNFDVTDVQMITREREKHESYEREYSILSLRLFGNADFVSESKDISVRENDILYVPRGAKYTQSTAAESLISVHFMNYNSETRDMLVYRFQSINEVRELFTELYEVWTRAERGYRYLANSIFYKILYLLNLEFEGTESTDESYIRIKKACDFIHMNYKNQDISIKKLSKMVFLSATAFREHFKRAYGISPNKYIRYLRLEASGELLRDKNYTISAAAEAVGFGDAKYFTREFTKRFGMSPKAYKESAKKH